MVAVLSLVVSGVAALVAVVVYLVERTRSRVTPSWLPQRDKRSLDDPDERYREVRDQGRIHAVGEGTMEGAFLDVLHGSLVSGEFPRCYTFRDAEVSYRFIAHRAAVLAGAEPVVAMYWFEPGVFGRRFCGYRLHTVSLRYEELRRARLRPWVRGWVQAGKPPIDPVPLTAGRSLWRGVW